MRTVGGQEATFKALFAQEYSKLCRYALTFLHDTHQAEDVVQETFIKIWERKPELIGSPDIRFYLVTAVRNNCISALRKLKTQQTQFTEETPEPEPEPFVTATQQYQDASEQSIRIATALDKLPPKCREVFLLVKMQGLSYKQAAEALEISVKTVENQMGKAIKVLRDNLSARAIFLLLFFLFELLAWPVGVLKHSSVFK